MLITKSEKDFKTSSGYLVCFCPKFLRNFIEYFSSKNTFELVLQKENSHNRAKYLGDLQCTIVTEYIYIYYMARQIRAF